MTMEAWYVAKKDKTSFGNYDLVEIMYTLYDRLKKTRQLELMHINSHQKENGDENIKYNNLVDLLAKKALTYDTLDVVCNSDVLKII
jgi:hypothetical protein